MAKGQKEMDVVKKQGFLNYLQYTGSDRHSPDGWFHGEIVYKGEEVDFYLNRAELEELAANPSQQKLVAMLKRDGVLGESPKGASPKKSGSPKKGASPKGGSPKKGASPKKSGSPKKGGSPKSAAKKGGAKKVGGSPKRGVSGGSPKRVSVSPPPKNHKLLVGRSPKKGAKVKPRYV